MNTPKLADLQEALMSAFETRFGTIRRGVRAIFRTLAQVFAGELYLFYLSGAKVQKNVFPDLADTEVNGGTLERFGRARLGRDPFPASQGIYLLDITGSAGGTVQQGVIFKANNGYNYSVEASVTLTGSKGQVTVRALTPGMGARLMVADELNATQPILNVDTLAVVASEVEEPIDEEDIEDYRSKVLQSFRIEAQGGASGDYRLWAADAQGVREVYPFVGDPGEVDLYIEATLSSSTDGKGTPTTTIINNVEEVVNLDPDETKSLNDRGRLPMNVYAVNYLPITPLNVDVAISGYTGNISEAQTAVAAALADYLYTVRPYVAGADASDNSNLSAQRLIGVAIAALPSEYNFSALSMGVDGTPTSLYRFELGNIPTVGAVVVSA